MNIWSRMSKDQWGPRAWYYLHSLAINYPDTPSENDAVQVLHDLSEFLDSLPCVECKYHARYNVSIHPPMVVSSDSFQIWAWEFHNTINTLLGKRRIDWLEYTDIYSTEIYRANLKDRDSYIYRGM